MRTSPFPWANLRWPKAPSGSVGERPGVRVTSHTSTHRATSTGLNSMSAGTYVMAAVMVGPFALMTLGMIALTVLVGPEGWAMGAVAVPFIIWRFRAFRRTRRGTAAHRRERRGAAGRSNMTALDRPSA